MTRIVGGHLSGRRLATPTGADTRPTSEKVRAALANALDAAGAIDGARVLDLYAGSGALGLEMASRGASSVVLVERARPALKAIAANIAALGADTTTPGHGPCQITVHAGDVASFATHVGDPFDLVLADPPYTIPDQDLSVILTTLHRAGRLAPGATVVLERSARGGEFTWPPPLVGGRTRRYGDTIICYGHAP